ncbi:hypothetical protein JCM6882_004861 [Rhodosporidiobolus microsporus]
MPGPGGRGRGRGRADKAKQQRRQPSNPPSSPDAAANTSSPPTASTSRSSKKRKRAASPTRNQSTPTPTPSPVKKARSTATRILIPSDTDQQRLDTLLDKISQSKAAKNGYLFFKLPSYPSPLQLASDGNQAVCTFICIQSLAKTPSSQLYSHGEPCDKRARERTQDDKENPRLSAHDGWEGVGGLEPSQVLQLIAEWVACDVRAYKIIKDAGLLPLLDPVVRQNMPGESTVSEAVIDLYKIFKLHIIGELSKRAVGAIYLGADAWLAANGVDLLGIVAFFKEKKEGGGLTKNHTSEYIRKVLIRCMDEFKITKRVQGIVSDNASNMKSCFHDLEVKNGFLDGLNTWLSCFTHVTNIATSTFNAYFTSATRLNTAASDPKGKGKGKKRRAAPIEWQLDNDEERESLNHARVVQEEEGVGCGDISPRDVDAIERDFDGSRSETPEVDDFPPRHESSTDAYSRQDVKDTFERCRLLSRKARYNPRVSEALKAISRKNKNPHTPHSIPRRMVVSKELQSDDDNGILPENQFDDKDFRILGNVVAVLEISFLGKNSTIACIYNAVLKAKAKLEIYYARSDSCVFYSVALVLHPSYGPAFLKQRRWPDAWIADAIERTQAWYDLHYRDEAEAVYEAKQEELKRLKETASSRPLSTLKQMRANHVAGISASALDFDKAIHDFAYRTTDIVPPGTAVDALEWFSNAEAGGRHFNGITAMALDLFVAPASSVDVERQFSYGGLMVSLKRHNLTPVSIAAGLALRGYRTQGFIKPGMLRKGRIDRRTAKATQKKLDFGSSARPSARVDRRASSSAQEITIEDSEDDDEDEDAENDEDEDEPGASGEREGEETAEDEPRA